MFNQDNLLSSIGNTPIVKLNNVFDNIKFNLYAKLECCNPSGSTKDRSALSMLYNAYQNKLLTPTTSIVESSSGNFGIALAQICLLLNIDFVCVIDPKTTNQNIRLLETYNAKIEMVTTPDQATGEYLPARKKRVTELLDQIPNSLSLDQYSNIYNPKGHYYTAKEITEHFDTPVDYIFCAVSTCGTMRGYHDYICENNLDTKIIAVDAIGSVIFGNERKKRLIPGHGAAEIPPLFSSQLASDYVQVSDSECVSGCHRLLKSESIFAGGSTGAIISAIDKYKTNIPKNSNCVMIVHDRGDRYLDTIYSNKWIDEHFKPKKGQNIYE